MSGARDRLTGAAYAAGWTIVRRLPESVMWFVFRALSDVAWRRRGPGVQRLEANLRRVVGDDPARLRAVSRAGLRSYARYWLDLFRLPVWSKERVLRSTTFAGTEAFRAMHADGRGVVLTLPHLANWDSAGAWLVASGFPFTTVAERLKPESLFDRFVAFRESLGMEVLALSGGERSPYEVLRARVKSGGIICLVSDRDLSATGIPVQFFGEAARMPAGPAMLAIATGAALIPVTLWYDGREIRGEFHAEIPVPTDGDRRAKVAAMTQQMADVFAGGISAHPEDWHMLQKFWVTDLSAERRAAVERAPVAPSPAGGTP
ncbi:MAG: phosphatidylinositol mannoside acyltransferase [Frankiales bacterium]|nr:phosphatidylinositol mannoside acyltransferase [Frankiales bacterium]